MKMKLGKYLIGLATAGLLTLISGCTVYKDELARFAAQEPAAQVRIPKKSDLEKSAEKESKALSDKKPEDKKKEEAKENKEKLDDVPDSEKLDGEATKTEKRSKTRAEKRSELDADDYLSFFKPKNTKTSINAFIGLSAKGTWDDNSNQEGYAFNLPQVKLLGKFGPKKAGRGILEHILTMQTDHGDPEDHEITDTKFKLSDIIGGFGWHFGDKDFMGYAELRLGAEYMDFDGPLNAYARDMLIGAKGKLFSESLDAKLMLGVLAGTGIFGDIGHYKGRVGDAGIPIEGDYGRVAAQAKIVKGLTDDLHARAKFEFDRKHFDNYLTIDNYLGSVGIEGRIKISGRPVFGSVDFYAKRKSKDFASAKPDDAWNEYGAVAQINIDLGRGVFLSAWVDYHQPDKYKGSTGRTGEVETGMSLKVIAGDLLEGLFG